MNKNNRLSVCIVGIAVFLLSTFVPALCQTPGQKLTANEVKVKPYLLADVRHFDEWPNNGWELFGLTASEIKSKYCSKELLNPAKYSGTTSSGTLTVNWGAANTTFTLKYLSGKVSSVTREDEIIFPYHSKSGFPALTSRAQALEQALDKANKEVQNMLNAKNGNPGFLWVAYRNRARILLALGKKDEAAKDLKSAETVELEILKNPAKAKEDNRPML